MNWRPSLFLPAILGLSAALAPSPQRAADLANWQFRQRLEVGGTGLIAFEVPAETLNASQVTLADVRIVSPSGTETPFVIDWPEVRPARLIVPENFRMILGDGVTTLLVETGTTEAIRALVLETDAADFLKSATVESSKDGAAWETAADNEILFRQSARVAKLRLAVEPQSYKWLRVQVDDRNGKPVAFGGAKLELAERRPLEKPHEATLAHRQELPGKTALTVDLGAANVFIGSIWIETPEPVFSRDVVISLKEPDAADGRERRIASASIHRIALNNGRTESLEIPIHRTVANREVRVEIDNEDSPPLQVSGIRATRHPIRVVLHAGEPGSWEVFTGHPMATRPRYDTAALATRLRESAAAEARVGSLGINPVYQKPTALPEIEPQGAGIDLSRWRYRKAISIREPGVVQVELDADVLARASLNLDDLRIVQGGAQLPFVIDSFREFRSIEPVVESERDAKRPAVSLWRVTMPLSSLPASSLSCRSPTALFERQITAWATTKDSLGNESRRNLGSARWASKPSAEAGELRLSFDGARLPDSFMLETDNGDNPAIEIENVRVNYPVPRLIAKAPAVGDVFLYYGNERATKPRYDLRLVDEELRSAPKQSAVLGDEEALGGRDRERPGEGGVGSPWLWTALAVVVIGLLWIVARMLPASQGADESR